MTFGGLMIVLALAVLFELISIWDAAVFLLVCWGCS